MVRVLLAVFTLFCLIVVVSCEKEEDPFSLHENIKLSDEIEISKKWLEKQIAENEQAKNWSQIYSPNFDWTQAKLLVSSQKDTVVEVPYEADREYKFGIGPAGSKGEYCTSKYLEPQATRVAISMKKGVFNAKLMHLFCDTLIVGNKKIWYKPEAFKDISFANSFYSSPNYSSLIFYAGLDEKFQSYKYYEKGKVREEGQAQYSLQNFGGSNLRSGCDLMTVTTLRYACTGYDGYPLYCKPYVEYSYVLVCTDANPNDSAADDTNSGGSSGGDPVDTQEEEVELPCVFDLTSSSQQIGRVSTSASPKLSTVTAYVSSSCHIGSDGQPDRDLETFITNSSGGSANIQYQGNDKNESFVGRNEFKSCTARHTYNVRVTLLLTPHVINVGGGGKGVNVDINTLVQPVSRYTSSNPTFVFW